MNKQKKTPGRRPARRITALLLVLVMVCSLLFPQNVSANIRLQIPSHLNSHYSFAVMDSYSGELLMGDHATKRIYPASTTKLMSAVVILERMKKDNIKLSKKVKITQSMLNQVPSSLSVYGLRAGETYTLNTLLNMTLIMSAGDAVTAAAIAVFGSLKHCVQAMNRKAKELKMKRSHFQNVTGLDVNAGYKKHYSTAADIAKLTIYAMQNTRIRKIVAKSSYQVRTASGKKGRKIYSTNLFYSRVSYNKKLYTIIGAKTGTTTHAGHVFTACAIDAKGHMVVCSYMGKVSSVATFRDIDKILSKVFRCQKSGRISLALKKTSKSTKTTTLVPDIEEPGTEETDPDDTKEETTLLPSETFDDPEDSTDDTSSGADSSTLAELSSLPEVSSTEQEAA